VVKRRESSPQITQINTEKKGSRKSVKICGKKKRVLTTDYTD
jgi:hypothetical protein